MMKKGMKRKIGGAVVLVAAVGSVFLGDWKKGEEELPELVRPLKTYVIGKTYRGAKWQYPGKVNASRDVDVAFEVAGTVSERLVREGDRVEEGQLLVKLDPADYANAADAAKAEEDRARAQLERMQEAAKSNAVSKQEVSNAQAAYDKAGAEYRIRLKALADTEIHAQFGGVIVRTYVKQYENIQAKQPILNLQDLSVIEIETSIPEARIAQIDPNERRDMKQVQQKMSDHFTARFDYFPDRVFNLSVKEFSPDADPVTQTYSATFVMETASDLTIFPGMTAMVMERDALDSEVKEGAALLVPLDAVPVDGIGQYYVWLLVPDTEGVFSLTRRDVTVGELSDGNVTILSGLKKGDRIAAAGVHVVIEGQKVSLLETDS